MARERRVWESDLLRAAREALGMTLREAAEEMIKLARDRRVREPGVTAQTIFRHEHGSFPGPDYRRLYCLLYQKSVSANGSGKQVWFRRPVAAPWPYTAACVCGTDSLTAHRLPSGHSAVAVPGPWDRLPG